MAICLQEEGGGGEGEGVGKGRWRNRVIEIFKALCKKSP